MIYRVFFHGFFHSMTPEKPVDLHDPSPRRNSISCRSKFQAWRAFEATNGGMYRDVSPIIWVKQI